MAATLVDVRCNKDSGSIIEGDTITFIVGEVKRTFYVHEQLICAHSAFFETALSKEWKEGVSRVVELPENDAATFCRYVHWLYSGKIASKLATGEEHWGILARLYGLGEVLMDKIFQDRVIDSFVMGTREKRQSGSRHFPTKRTIDTVYKMVPAGSPARRLMVDMYVMHGKPRWIDIGGPDQNNKEFLADLAIALLAKRHITVEAQKELGEIDVGVPCSYHQHGKDEPCEGKAA